MSARDIIIRPVVSEKATGASEHNYVTFRVAKNANKSSIAQAIQEIYKVKPVRVNVVNVHPKTRRVGRYVGKTVAYKKAIVKFADGEMIDIFNTED